MRLDYVKGIHRASLCLAVGYLDKSDKNESFITQTDKCVKVVAKYLNNNGIKFDFLNNRQNKELVLQTVHLAEYVVFSGMELERAIQKLEETLF